MYIANYDLCVFLVKCIDPFLIIILILIASIFLYGQSPFLLTLLASLSEPCLQSGSFSECVKVRVSYLFRFTLILTRYVGAILPGFMIVTSMFYTRAEQIKRTGYWCKARDS